MLFSEETKERFIKMLKDRQIIAIRCNQGRKKSFAYKFIGANNDGKWDFTPLVANESNFPTTKNTSIYDTAIFANDGVGVVEEALKNLRKDGFLDDSAETKDYFKIRELLTFFYI